VGLVTAARREEEVSGLIQVERLADSGNRVRRINVTKMEETKKRTIWGPRGSWGRRGEIFKK